MDPITILASVNAAMKLAKVLLPEVDRLFQAGLISVEQQSEANAEYQSLRTVGDGQFQGAHWQIDPDTPPPTE